MPKVFYFVLVLSLIIFGFAIIFPKPTFALQGCPNPVVQTIPTGEASPRVLKSTDRGAEFTIDVNRKSEEDGGVKGWIMEWECSRSNRGVASSADGDNNIRVNLTNVGGNCAFKPHDSHIVKVKQIVSTGEVDYCQATYKVNDTSELCQLSLKAEDKDGKPTNSVTTTSTLKLSASNTVNSLYGIFVDEFLFANATGDFEDKPLPTSRNTKMYETGPHTISLRLWENRGISLNIFDDLGYIGSAFKDGSYSMYFGKPLCRIPYTVGDGTKPGTIGIPTNAATTGAGPTGVDCTKPGACTSGGGVACDPNKGSLGGSGGILTAIGCVPTEPKALINGIIKFVSAGAGAIALLLMVLGALKMITSDGNPETIQGGKDQFTASFLGLLFVIFSVLLLQVIGVDILGIPEFVGR